MPVVSQIDGWQIGTLEELVGTLIKLTWSSHVVMVASRENDVYLIDV